MAIVAATAAIVGATGLSVPAFAADPPVVNWANSIDNDLGRLRVSVTSDSGVASIRAHIVSYATQQEVADTDGFEIESSDGATSTWFTTDRFQLAQLGGYRVDIEVTDNDGQRTSRTDAGSLAYFVATSFDRVVAKPATLTYARREVTLSGRLLGRWPGDGHIEPLAGFPVNLSSYPGDFGAATTLADGTFSGPLHLDAAGSVYAYYSYDNDHIGYLSGNSAELPVGISPASARATVTASRAKVKAGETVTLTGQLTWRAPDGWRPFANKQFGVLFCYDESTCPWSDYPTTDAEGRYQIEVAPYRTGFYRVSVSSDDPFIASPSAQTGTITVLQPASFSSFSAARAADGVGVSVSGRMEFSPFYPQTAMVDIQYSPDGKAPWTTVRVVETDWRYEFNATIPSAQSGFWRARFASQPDFYQTAVSTKVKVI
ncbi:hypothetical protein O7598_28050 [Micromonospora sp. WMMC241]|uniref:hypothetical protein n=1 Tax=Micromonospora sp. WMMC241 TaxID=3015159 RepID=UPI0022B6B328|nr:hypothetical protein [Micromonospora sp. WMMC241]MCZ7440281.1 hypothetical protein [Micromonospora sp. WMMC241]